MRICYIKNIISTFAYELYINKSNMITIDGINVDTASSPDSLMTECTVFTVEFEYDCKILIGHAFNYTAFRSIKRLIALILNNKMENLELRRALLSSKYITINILKEMKPFIRENNMLLDEKKCVVLKEKYSYIKKYNTYYPYGYNILTDAYLAKGELIYARQLYNDLVKEIDASSLYVPSDLKVIQRGRPGKMVHKFNAKTGLYLETYNSVKEAAIATNTSPSNISACCNDKSGQKTTGGFKWSYDKSIIFTN